MDKVLKKRDQHAIRDLFRVFAAVGLIGPRQSGKTTLARMIGPDHWFDLENPRDLARLSNPLLALEELRGLIAIDEIQRQPGLFSVLRYLIDQKKGQKYLLLGSASPDLIKHSSESLAGRIGFHHLQGFGIQEAQWERLWLRGALPPSYLAADDRDSWTWRGGYVTTFLERDIPQLGIAVPSGQLRLFWTMVAHVHGNVLNYSELGRSLGVSDTTIRRYLSILEGTFMVRLLQPFHANVSKRLVKNPKIYLRDSGLLHFFQQISGIVDLQGHHKCGSSFEGFAVEQLSLQMRPEANGLYYYRTHNGTELDLVAETRQGRLGFEIKYSDAPTLTRSMRIAFEDLDLQRMYILYPGQQMYQLDEKIEAWPISAMVELCKKHIGSG
ncbi:MAG: ATP-binding protein [Spirochaetales bacterium]|nr:ATP-binding protein [Spirochaetales bacterium]